MATDLTVRVRALDGSVGATDWLTLGNGRARGIVPQNVTLSADQSGPSSASMVLRRDPRVPWGDILAATQMEVEVGGVVVWGGRISQTPTSADQISVTGQGWQYHLDDDQLDTGWVVQDLGQWKQIRDFSTTPLNGYTTAYQIDTNGGVITISVPNNAIASGSTGGAVVLDAGPNRTIKRIVVTYTSGAHASFTLSMANGTSVGTASETVTIDAAPIAAGPTTAANSFATARRYSWVQIAGPVGAVTGDNTSYCTLTSIIAFPNASYESGNASVLKASNVFTDVLASGGLPLLDSSTSAITTTSFSIPDFWPDSYRTPREILAAANAYHDYLWGVNANRQLFLTARPTTPLYEVGSWSAADFADASAGNLEDLYNKVIVEYEAPDGTPGRNTRTSTSNVLTRQGLTRTKRLGVSAALTSAAADQIGDTWLLRRATTPPLRGSFKATAGAVRYLATGADVHPSWLLLGTGQIVRLLDRIDPDTGGWGRDGNVISVTYSHDSEEATVQLDNDSTSLEALLARLALMQGRGTV